MKSQDLKGLFIEELEDMLSAEHQIIHSLPKLIKLVSISELKDALSSHLKETQHQVKRIEKIFSILGMSPSEKTCKAMQGLLKEADEIVENKALSPVLDAAIISAAQKVEHYEIASYGTLRSIGKQLGLDSEIIDLLTETLEEEGGADKKLTKIAEGSSFSSGVNQEAASHSGKHR